MICLKNKDFLKLLDFTPEEIAYLLELEGRTQKTVMVGDTAFDVIGAAAHKIPTIGVSWGYGDVGEMLEAGACAIADTPEELGSFLMQEAEKA